MRVNNRKGMTLIEIIIALAILSVITLALSGFLSYGMKGFHRTNEIVEEQSQLRLASNSVSRLLRNAMDVQLMAVGTVPAGDTSTPSYIFIKNNQLVVRDDEQTFILMPEYSPTINFSITDGDKVTIDFTITSSSGYSVDSSLMLNNYGVNIENGLTLPVGHTTSGDAISFNLP